MRIRVNGNTAILKTTYLDNNFIDEDYKKELEALKNEDEYFYNVYTLGNWTTPNITGRCYKKFSDNNILEYTYNPLLPIDLCLDFNVSPMKWALIQEVNGNDYIFDEIVKEDTDTEDMILTFVRKYPNTEVNIYGDYSGTFRSTSSRTTDYEIIQSYLPRAEIYVKPNPPVVNRVNAVNWRLQSKENRRRMFVSPNCKHVINDFRKVKWKDGKREIDKSDMNLTHISDGIGYRTEYKYSLKGKPSITQSQGLIR